MSPRTFQPKSNFQYSHPSSPPLSPASSQQSNVKAMYPPVSSHSSGPSFSTWNDNGIPDDDFEEYPDPGTKRIVDDTNSLKKWEDLDDKSQCDDGDAWGTHTADIKTTAASSSMPSLVSDPIQRSSIYKKKLVDTPMSAAEKAINAQLNQHMKDTTGHVKLDWLYDKKSDLDSTRDELKVKVDAIVAENSSTGQWDHVTDSKEMEEACLTKLKDQLHHSKKVAQYLQEQIKTLEAQKERLLKFRKTEEELDAVIRMIRVLDPWYEPDLPVEDARGWR